MPNGSRLRPDTPSPLTLSRPAIYMDGERHEALTQDLIALSIEHAISSPAVCTARFANVRAAPDGRSEYAYFGLNDVNFGRRCAVWLGVSPNTLVRLFDGRINLLEAGFDERSAPSLVVQAEDALQEFRLRSRTRVFQDFTDAKIIQSIAADHGLTANIELSAPQVTHARIAQLHQNDLAFLLDRVLAIGAMVWVEQQTLVVRDTVSTGGPGALTYGENLQSFTVRADVRNQASAHGVAGWDVTSKQPIAQSANESDLLSDSNNGRSGGEVLAEGFGPRLETMVDAMPMSTAEAASLATAAYRRNAAEFVTGSGVAVQVPTLRAGNAIDVVGVGPLFSGNYQVTAVRHLFDAEHGFRTEFDVRRPRLARPRMYTKPREAVDADPNQRGTDTRGAAGGTPVTGGSPRIPDKRGQRRSKTS